MDYEITFSVPYDAPRPESDDAPENSQFEIAGLSSFLALAIELQVPILAADISVERWGRSTLGAGTSFLVGRSYSSSRTSYLSTNATISGDYGGLGERFKSCNGLVCKRLCRKQQHDGDDGRCLAPLVQELRILSHATLRDLPNLVRMICLDWSADSIEDVGGRCWPSMLLECATYGTLGQYLLNSPQLSWNCKWMLCLNIGEGLKMLHKHGIAHCDLKLDNILVFENPDCKFAGVDVVAKISDFGYSLITSDYDAEAVFHGRAGTPPWNAPEIAFARKPLVHSLPKADIYSMGLLVCAIILNGHPPWEFMSATEFQYLKESNDDQAVSRVLTDALSEAIPENDFWIGILLMATVKSAPSDRLPAGAILKLIRKAFLAHICDVEGIEPSQIDRSIIVSQAIIVSEKLRSAVTPLPNIFSPDFENNDSEPFNSVPDFTSIASFRPFLLDKYALLEVINDLSRRSDGRQGDTTVAVAEVEYQLCICHLEGYGVEESIPLGLNYLARAFEHGSPKVRCAARNFYDACRVEFPGAMAETEESDLCTAIDGGRWPNMLIATTALAHRYPLRYKALVSSAGERIIHRQQLVSRAAHLRAEILHAINDWVQLDQPIPVPAERRAGTRETTDPDELSPLHRAAALGDVESVTLLSAHGDMNTATAREGWTPLWMACAGGSLATATVLLDRGASMSCRETSSGSGILHLLGAFHTITDIEEMVRRARKAGLDINGANSDGVTPLLATFTQCDTSCGTAARVLLAEGANPFLADCTGMCPLVMCVANLDPSMLRAMLACPATSGVSPAVVCGAQMVALGVLILQSPAFQIACLGLRREGIIKDVLRQLLSTGSTQRFMQQPDSNGFSPLAAAVWADRSTLASWILEVRPQDVDLQDVKRDTALQWAIRRNRGKLVKELLAHDACPLNTNNLGCNALHVAALSMPAFMSTIAMSIVNKNCGGDPGAAKEWLNGVAEGLTAFEMAVMAGSPDHLQNAECLRSRYRLEYDSPMDGNGPTLLGWIVQSGSVTDRVNLAQVEYLLSLRPKPRFVIHEDGSTLLHTAVMGWKNAAYSDGAVAYDILALLLREFPSQEHLETRDDCGCSPLIKAAFCANPKAIAMMRDHAKAHGFSLNVNLTEGAGLTALDGVGCFALKMAPGDETNPLVREPMSALDPGTRQLLEKNILLTEQILVQMGAVNSRLLAGIAVWTVIVSPISVPHDRLIRFLAAKEQEHVGISVHEYPAPIPEDMYISLECSWRVSTFSLTLAGFPSMTEAKDHAVERTKAGKALVGHWHADHGALPWAETHYNHNELGISSDRPGRTWDRREIIKMHFAITRALVAATGSKVVSVVM